MSQSGWIGVDLDGTLAKYGSWNGGQIGDPIPLMVERVKQWIAEGVEVRIFTARVGSGGGYSLESGRSDDNEEVIRHRLDVYASETEPLISSYAARGLVVMVDGLGTIDEVTERILEALNARLGVN